jgi:DNA-directed RNA polymerase specialized sigma24 family protein
VNPVVIKAYAARLSAERGRRVTHSEAEADIHRVIRQMAANLSGRFVYGYHTREDIEQEGVMLALEVLAEDPPKYDARRPLENFLHVHLRNQLSNQKRKVFNRPEAPCTCCDPYNPPAQPCRKWEEWQRRNTSKRNIMRPISMDSVQEDRGLEPSLATASRVEDDAVCDEMLERIDRDLPPDLRGDYLRMRENVPVPKSRRQHVREAVLRILGEGTDGEV